MQKTYPNEILSYTKWEPAPFSDSDRIIKIPNMAYSFSWFGSWLTGFISTRSPLYQIGRMSETDKDLKILMPRHQLDILNGSKTLINQAKLKK